MFPGFSKHLEFRQKYSASISRSSILKSLIGIYFCETLVFDIYNSTDSCQRWKQYLKFQLACLLALRFLKDLGLGLGLDTSGTFSNVDSA